MLHIIGGFIAGAAAGVTTRKVEWRPLLRNVIKGGIVVTRKASSVTAAIREDAISLYEEAKAELREAETAAAEEPEHAGNKNQI
jgi:hypothetical protein